ncbi:MAG: CotH kinase family protein [Bacteroidota bacterium]
MKKIVLLFSFCLGLVLVQGQSDSNFYKPGQVQDLQITFEQEDWRYLLDSLRFNGDDMLLGNISINGTTLKDVGVRYRNSRTFRPGMNRNALYIKLNYIKKKQNYGGHKVLELSNALRDPSMVREVLGYEIARSYMPAPQANYAKVMVNDDYYGLLVNLEAVDEAFLQTNFGNTDGSFFKSTPNLDETPPSGCRSDADGSLQYDGEAKCYLHNFTILSEDGWDDLIELTRILEQEPQRIEEVLNVDRTLWMLAFNNVVVNLNSYSGRHNQNYYLYKDKDGRFNPIIWDLNLCFGSYKNTGVGSDLRFTELAAMDPMLHMANEKTPLISKLLQNDDYKKVYLSHIRTILDDFFLNSAYESRAKDLQGLIKGAYMEDRNRYYNAEEFNRSLTSTIGKRSKIPGIVQLMDRRADFLKGQDMLSIIPPAVKNITLAKREPLSSKQIKDFEITATVEQFPKEVKVFYRFGGEMDFQQTKMMDDGQHNDGEANDGVFGVTLTPGSGQTSVEYYIFAENAKMVSYSPSNYMYKRHTASLAELNK